MSPPPPSDTWWPDRGNGGGGHGAAGRAGVDVHAHPGHVQSAPEGGVYTTSLVCGRVWCDVVLVGL